MRKIFYLLNCLLAITLTGCETVGLDNEISGKVDGYAYVDLGLISGTKWATCNVGASSPEDYGYYFAWGEVSPKFVYDSDSYKWSKGSYYSKYCVNKSDGFVDNKKVLDLSDDAAYVNWGSSWRMPTKKELDELRTQCNWEWVYQNGVLGYKVISRTNGKSIFLPAAGCISDTKVEYNDVRGCYWGATLNSDKNRTASNIDFKSYFVDENDFSRSIGLSVRPVLR